MRYVYIHRDIYLIVIFGECLKAVNVDMNIFI